MTTDNNDQSIIQIATAAGTTLSVTCPPVAVGIAVVAVGAGIAYGLYSFFAGDDSTAADDTRANDVVDQSLAIAKLFNK